MITRANLHRFITWAEDILHRGERGDEDALHWFGFANLTAITLIVAGLVLLAWRWI